MTYKELEELLQNLTIEEKDSEFQIKRSDWVISFPSLFIEVNRADNKPFLVDESYLVKEFKHGSSTFDIAEKYGIPVLEVEKYIRGQFYTT